MVYRTWRFSTPIDDPYKKTRQTAGLFVSGAQWDSTYGARNSSIAALVPVSWGQTAGGSLPA